MPPYIPRIPPSSTLLRRRRHLSSSPSLPAALFPSRNATLPQMPPPIAGIPACSPLLLFRRLCSSAAAAQKLERIADDLLSLSDAERHDYSLLLRLRLRLPRFGPTSSAMGPAAPSTTAAAPEAKEEKTAFDVKLESFDAAVKIKVIKEVRAVAELGLKEAKEMVEKAPVVVRRGVAKEEAEAIMARLKESGAKVVLE